MGLEEMAGAVPVHFLLIGIREEEGPGRGNALPGRGGGGEGPVYAATADDI